VKGQGYIFSKGGHDGVPPARRVTFAAGNDATQMLGAWLNWRRWGLEEHGVEIDAPGFISEWTEKARSGTFLQLVGWDGAEPVAIVELRIIYDSMLRRQTLWGDHAYVHPDYRRRGVMTDLVDFCIDIANVLEIKHWVVPVTAGADATAPWLRKVYEDAGFTQSGITMSRRVA